MFKQLGGSLFLISIKAYLTFLQGLFYPDICPLGYLYNISRYITEQLSRIVYHLHLQKKELFLFISFFCVALCAHFDIGCIESMKNKVLLSEHCSDQSVTNILYFPSSEILLFTSDFHLFFMVKCLLSLPCFAIQAMIKG